MVALNKEWQLSINNTFGMTEEEIQHIARLARLELSDEQLAKAQHDFDEILGYFDQLTEVNVDGIEPMRGATDLVNQLRDDTVTRESGEAVRNKYISLAPEHTEEYIETISPFRDTRT